MKKSFIVIFFLLNFVSGYSQSFNLSMGLGISSQLRKTYPEQGTSLLPLWTINGRFGRDFRILKNLYWRAEISYYQEGILYDSTMYSELFHYLSFDNFLLFRSYRSPVYFGIGGYGSRLMALSATINGQTLSLPVREYNPWDYGVMPLFGLVLDFDFISYYMEARYRFGLNDIYIPSDNYIKNRGFEFNVGVSLRIH